MVGLQALSAMNETSSPSQLDCTCVSVSRFAIGEMVEVSDDEEGGGEGDEEEFMKQEREKLEQEKERILNDQTMISEVEAYLWSTAEFTQF